MIPSSKRTRLAKLGLGIVLSGCALVGCASKWTEDAQSEPVGEVSSGLAVWSDMGWDKLESSGGSINAGASASWVPGSSPTWIDLWLDEAASLVHVQVIGSAIGRFTNWGSPPGGLSGNPASAYHDNQFDVVVRGASNNTLYYRTYTSAGLSASWVAIPNGVLTSSPAVAMYASNRLEVFALGQADANGRKAVWHTLIQGTTPTGGWDMNPGVPPGGAKAAPAAFSRALGQIDVVVQGTNGALYQSHYSGTSWSQWAGPLGGFWETNQVIAGLGSVDGTGLDIFARGSDGVIYHTSFSTATPSNAAALVWDAGGGTPGASAGYSVAVSKPSSGRLDVYAANSSGLWRKKYYQSAPSIASSSVVTLANVNSGWTRFTQTVSTPANTPPTFWETSLVVTPQNAARCSGVAKRAHIFNGSVDYGLAAQSDSWGTSALDVTDRLYKPIGGTWADTQSCPPSPLSPYPYKLGNDPNAVRMSNGDIIHIRLGRDCNAPSAQNNQAGHLFLWQSTDCGKNWSFFPSDSSVGFGGADRVEMYADPWSKRAWAFGQGGSYNVWRIDVAGGPATITPLTFTLGPPGQVGQAFSFDNNSWQAMTSSPNGRLFFLKCPSGTPTLYWTDPGAATASSTSTRLYSTSVSADSCAVFTAAGGNAVTGGVTVSRLGSWPDGDSVRVTYPILVSGSQQLRMYGVKVTPSNTSTVTAATYPSGANALKATTAGGSVWQPTLIETNRVDLDTRIDTNIAVLYWQETTASPSVNPGATCMKTNNIPVWAGFPAGTQMTYKAIAVRDLDLTGTRVSLTSATTTFGATGDYLQGSFYYDGSYRFTAVWPGLTGLISGACSASSSTLTAATLQVTP